MVIACINLIELKYLILYGNIQYTMCVLVGSANVKTHPDTYQPGKNLTSGHENMWSSQTSSIEYIYGYKQNTGFLAHNRCPPLGHWRSQTKLVLCDSDLKFQAFTLANQMAIGDLIRVNSLY